MHKAASPSGAASVGAEREARLGVDDPTRYAELHTGPTAADAAVAGGLTERVALAMADAEGNRDAQVRAHSNNYDAFGYGALAAAACSELERLGALVWPAATDAATGTVGKP